MDIKEKNGEMISPIAFCFPRRLRGRRGTGSRGESGDYKRDQSNTDGDVLYYICNPQDCSGMQEFNKTMALASYGVLFGIF